MPGDVIGHVTAEAADATGFPSVFRGRHRQRQGGRDVGRRFARRSRRRCVARHLHRGDGARPTRTTRPQQRSGPTSPASRTATSTRATAFDVACGRSAGSSICSVTELTERAAVTRAGTRGLHRTAEARAVPAGSDGLGDRCSTGWRRRTGRIRKGVDARLRCTAHPRSSLPLDPRGDRVTMKEQRRRDVRGARVDGGRDRRLGWWLPQPSVHADLCRCVRHPAVSTEYERRRCQPRCRDVRRGRCRQSTPTSRPRGRRHDQSTGNRSTRPASMQRVYRRSERDRLPGLRDATDPLLERARRPR